MENEKTAWVSVETTGLDVREARVVKIDILVVRDKSVLQSLNTLVNPEIPIPKDASDYNGITDDMVADAPKFSEIATIVLKFLNDCGCIGGDSISFFDLAVLMSEFERLGMEFNVRGKRIVDTNEIYKKCVRRGLDEKLKECLNDEDYEKMSKCVSRNVGAYDNDAFRSLMLYRVLARDYELDDMRVDDICGNVGRIDLAGFFVKDFSGNVLFARGKYSGKNINDVDMSYFQWMCCNPKFNSDTRDIAARIIRARYSKR